MLLASLRPKQPLYKGEVSPQRSVPPSIIRPSYVNKSPSLLEYFKASFKQVQNSAEEQHKMRNACKLAAYVLDEACKIVRPGITTDQIDALVHKLSTQNKAYPSPLQYSNFPKSVCTSVNECICHGIPDSRQLQNGDILNIDVTVYLEGYHGDTSRTVFVGSNHNEAVKNLVNVTQYALHEAIKVCKVGTSYSQIGHTIHNIADQHNLGVVSHFSGHGVGQLFHSAPTIIHARNNIPGKMSLHETFTIEPMLCLGEESHLTWDDQWTIVTKDGCYTSQFEHTIIITEKGAEILTTQ